MALKVTKAEIWAGDLRDQPGGLADVLEKLARAGASVECVIARRHDTKPGTGKIFVTPIKGRKVQEAAQLAGLQHATKLFTLRVEGPDKPGLGARITRAIANANVNVRGISAAVIGGKFVVYIGLDSDTDADAAAEAVQKADRSSGRGRTSGRAKTRTGAKARAGARSGRTRSPARGR